MTDDDTADGPETPLEALKTLRDEADDAAEKSLNREESAYEAYEDVACRAQYFIELFEENPQPDLPDKLPIEDVIEALKERDAEDVIEALQERTQLTDDTA